MTNASLWEPGTQYNYNDVVEYQGSYYKIIQPHRSQGDWTPPVVPALWGKMQGPPQGHTPAAVPQVPQQQQQQPYQQPPPPQYTNEKPTQSQGPAQTPEKSWASEHKTELAIGAGLLGLGGIAAGAFAVNKAKDDKETHQAGFSAWVADAEARAAQFRQHGSNSPATWILNRGKNIPPHAILVGKEKSWNLYIARGYIKGSIQLGKASDVFKEGAVLGYGGDEHHLGTYEILIGDMSRLKWVPTSGRLNIHSLGAQPVEGGRDVDGTILYVAKASHKGAEHPGKASEKLDGAFIPYNNDEEKVKNYSVLCYTH